MSLEFRTPPKDIIKYPPSAIWQRKRKRRMKRRKGREGGNIGDFFGTATTISDFAELNYEEGNRVRETARQLNILSQNIQNERDRLRLEGEIGDIRVDIRRRGQQIEERRDRRQGRLQLEDRQRQERRDRDRRDFEDRRLRLEERRIQEQREQAGRQGARYERLLQDQQQFFRGVIEEGERRQGEFQANLQDFIRQAEQVRGVAPVIQIRPELEEVGEEPLLELAPPAETEAQRFFKAQVKTPRGRAEGLQPQPEPEPPAQSAEEIARRGQEVAREAQEDLEQEVPVVPQANIAELGRQIEEEPERALANIAQLEQQIEEEPETALGQLGQVAGQAIGGVVRAITGGGESGIARIPVRAGEQSGQLGVAIQREEGVVAEGVFGAQEGEQTFLLPEVPVEQELRLSPAVKPPVSPRFKQRQRRGARTAVPAGKGLELPASRILIEAQEQQGTAGSSPRDRLPTTPTLFPTPIAPAKPPSPPPTPILQQQVEEARQRVERLGGRRVSLSPAQEPTTPQTTPPATEGGGQVEVVEEEAPVRKKPEFKRRTAVATREELRKKDIARDNKLLQEGEAQEQDYKKQYERQFQVGQRVNLRKAGNPNFYLLVDKKFGGGSYVSQNQGLYNITHLPAKKGTASGTTEHFGVEYEHAGKRKQTATINPNTNAFKEALADGRIRFVSLKPKGAVADEDV